MPSSPSDDREHARPNGVGVLYKTDAILAFLEQRPSGAGPTEVAEALEMTKSTAFRLLVSLEGIGLVDALPGGGRYKLGLRLLRLGRAVQDGLRLRDVAQPTLERLGRETGLTIYLCARDGSDAVCVESISGRHVDILELKPGGRLPPYAGGAGRTMLMGLSDEAFERLLASAPFPRKTPNTLTEATQLRLDRDESRLRGFVVSREDVTIGIGAVAAPIHDVSRNVVGALSIAGLMTELDRLNVEALGARARAEAEDISVRMGYAPS